MKPILVVLTFIALAAWGLFALREERRQEIEAQHRYIYGFPPHRSQRSFAEYLEPITAEGLREIRWDHRPLQIVVAATSSTSTAFTITSAATGSWVTCMPPSTYVAYSR